MNFKLVKYIALCELNWRFDFLMKVSLASLLLVVHSWLFPEEAEDMEPFYFLLSLFALVTTSTSSIVASAVQQVNQPEQSGAFSWKYLQSLARDKKSFLIGYVVGGVLCSFPLLILACGYTTITKFSNLLVLLGLFSIILVIVFFRLQSFVAMINLPRTFTYKYNRQTGIMAWFFNALVGQHRLINFIAVTAALASFIALGFTFNDLVGTLSVIVSLIFLITLTYKKVLKIWQDERLSYWNFKREYPGTIFKVLLASLFIYIFSLSYIDKLETQNKIFDAIDENNLSIIGSLANSMIDMKNDKDGLPPLFYAITKGRLDAVETLVDNGADIEARLDKDLDQKQRYMQGMTPLLYAIDRNAIEIVSYLIDQKADMTATNHAGVGALAVASSRCNLPIMKKLIDSGINLNSKTQDGLTALHFAGHKRSCLSAVIMLHNAGADASIKDNEGRTYLEFFKQTNNVFWSEINFYYENLL